MSTTEKQRQQQAELQKNYGVLRMIYVETWMQASLEIIF